MSVKPVSLYEAQQEIKKLFTGKAVNYEVLSKEACEEIAIYKSLVLSSIKSLLTSIYPLSYKFLGEFWNDLVLGYIEDYPSDSAVFNRAAAKFPEYLAAEKTKSKFSYPAYLAELALYEWLELEIYHYAEELEDSSSEGLKDSLKLCPAYIVCNFSFPVTEITQLLHNAQLEELLNAQLEPKLEQVLIYRDEESGSVHFLKLAATTAFAIEMIEEGLGIDEIAQELLTRLKLPEENLNKFKSDLTKLIDSFKEKKIIV